VENCLHFVRTRLPCLLNKSALDVHCLTVFEISTGGHLNLLAFLSSELKPVVIMLLEVITDLLSHFFIASQPIAHGHFLASLEEMVTYLDTRTWRRSPDPDWFRMTPGGTFM